MNSKKIRNEVYEIVWSIITQQLMQHITINDDPEDDRLEDIGERLEIGKYNSVFSWRMWRDGQRLTINAYDNGNVSIVIEEQLHRNITITIIYYDNKDTFLDLVKKTIIDLVHTFLEGNWHILADFLSPSATGDTDWIKLIEFYKEYELKYPYILGNIIYI